MFEKPFSQACENNKRPILAILERAFANSKVVLEIGSGTGQHATFFAQHLGHLVWHTSDQVQYHQGINAYIDELSLTNIIRPRPLKVGEDSFPEIGADAFFSANTAHIMQKQEVMLLMHSISEQLPPGGVFCQYGPFTQNGKFNAKSNEEFHHSLLERGYGGYRDIDELREWAGLLSLAEVIDMPANNHMLIWKK